MAPVDPEVADALTLGLQMLEYWDNGKSNGNYYSILGVSRDNGK